MNIPRTRGSYPRADLMAQGVPVNNNYRARNAAWSAQQDVIPPVNMKFHRGDKVTAVFIPFIMDVLEVGASMLCSWHDDAGALHTGCFSPHSLTKL